MGSFMNNGKSEDSQGRRGGNKRRRGLPSVESLEGRLLLDGGGRTWQPTSTDLADVRNGPMANEGATLIGVYQNYLKAGGNASSLAGQYPDLQFKGDKVGVSISGTGNFNTFLTSLTSLGVSVTTSSSLYGRIEGYAPISALPTIANLPQTLSAAPAYRPRTAFVGAANNEAETSLKANLARAQFGVDGTGITVGALSDSVSRFAGGLADSVKTGDLPNNVTVIQDGPAGQNLSDEGRAMLENIHDIAPGSPLQFASAFISELQYKNNIIALADAGSKVIVDDVGYADEPFFQDGLVAQGVNNVVARGIPYFGAQYNTADQGYLSTFRPVSTTVSTLGAGTYMNFSPSGAAVTGLPITVAGASAGNPAELIFQFDQPFATQQLAGSTAAVTSEVDFYVLDGGGNVVATGNNNNVATREPIQIVTVPTNGAFTVVIKVASGSNPGHVEFMNFNENTDTIVSKQFAGAGGTYYPSGFAHASAINTIGVGAVPWWATTPYLGTNPLNAEPFSSFGPRLSIFNPDGSPKATPVLVQSPVVSGPDGGNTSFFPPGGVIDTSRPPFPGQPATPTNLSQNLPSFFGTSSAAPNVAAVAALMLQKSPALTQPQIKAALITSASTTPINGSAPGAWNPQGGFGLVDAVQALNAVSQLQVLSTIPANGATVTVGVNAIIAIFSKAVDFSTITSKDLAFIGVPTSLTSITTQTPVALDDPLHPTKIAFPFQFTVAPNQLGNGKFNYAIKSPAGGPTILSYEGPGNAGKPLQEYDASFTLNDVTAPRVQNTTLNNRVVTVQFDKAMSPASINANTVYVQRVDSNGVVTNLNNSPQFKLSYDTTTNTATLDYTGLNQVQLGNGTYILVVKAGTLLPNGTFDVGVTDIVGNKLNGHFNGVFPSGDANPPAGLPLPFSNFVESFGFITVQAPIITSFDLLPSSDTGIKGDSNTNISAPIFVGQIATSFPGTVSGLTVLAEFNSLHGGNLDLTPLNGRGYTGSFDVQVTTDANGTFKIPAPFLPEGFQRVRLVVIGQPDAPPLPGLSSSFDRAFKIDQTAPQVLGAALAPGAATLPLGASSTPLNALSNLSLNVVDPANPAVGPLATPAQVLYSALDPATATNISNYSLINVDEANSTDPTVVAGADKSRFITSATFVPTGSDFVSTPFRTKPSDPYFGRIDLAFATGLTRGHYQFIVHTKETVNGITYGGVTDAAANPLDNTNVPGQNTKDFVLNLQIQPEPVYITSVSTDVLNAQNNSLLPRSYYEINPRAGDLVSAPPTTFNVDFSNPLDPAKSYNDSLLLIGTADSTGGKPDGDFGTLGIAGLAASGTGFSRFNPPGTTVTLTTGKNGTNTRLVLQIPAGTVLPADHYRLYLPNTGAAAISDIYGNLLDGEFLGNPATSGTDPNGNPTYEDLLPNGQYRLGMSGDAVAGGSFMTGFTVVPTGNLVYARPDYVEDSLLPSSASDGSLARPYSVLAPQAGATDPRLPAGAKATLNNGDPNGGLNDSSNFLSGFDSIYDRAGIKRFARSAFYAAAQLSSRGPVVIVALPGTPQRDPISGVVTQKTFVLQAPAGSDPVINDGSGSVPFDTVLAFNPGSTLKLENASLFVQNQGSAVEALGGPNPNDRVNFTSYANDAIAGDSNGDAKNTSPRAGDWGGIVFRNFQQAGRIDTFSVDVTLTQGPNGNAAVSGEDDALSSINFANITYGGGAVPATQGIRYDEIHLINSRPSITNDTIIGGPGGGSQATISGDLDSFREDDLTRGPLIRRTTVSNSSINGIWVRPLVTTGIAQATDAIPYLDNPVTLGGVRNYTFNSPLPYVLTSLLDIGTQNVTDNVGKTTNVLNRLYISPGMMVKSEQGGGIRVLTPGASLIVGDRTYINRWDAEATLDFTNGLPTSTYGPNEAGFVPNTVGDAQVLFTTALDNIATTSYFDPITQVSTTIVPAIDTLNTNGIGQPSPGNVPDSSRWGTITLQSGSFGIIDEATIRYGGGFLNVPGGTVTDPEVLSFNGAAGGRFQFINGVPVFTVDTLGTRFLVTNNTFTDNKDAPMAITPDGLFAADTLRPLASGAPFFRGNIFQRNKANGLLVRGTGPGSRQISNVDVNSLWDFTDLTYIVRNTIVMGGGTFGFGNGGIFTPPPTTYLPEPKPTVVLTVQSALPGTLLANGQTIPRPGESVIIKLDNSGNAAPTPAQTQTGTVTTEDFGGAGFLAGVDNLVDPTADPTVDVGADSQMRFLGIGGNETTGQSRVPVIITSIHDSTVGTTVRGVKLFTAVDGDTTAPQAGDGGLIYFGGNELPNYNLLDPRGGSLIDNADIRYITRIEMQGGGMVDYIDANASNSFDAADGAIATKGGAFPPLPNGQPDPRSFAVQKNSSHALMISGSNLSSFLDAGIIEHPGGFVIAGGVRSAIAGEPNLLFLLNDTISNMPIGVQVVGDPNSDTGAFPEANELILLNNTFYNNPIAVDLNAIVYAPGTPQFNAQIHLEAMNNIFDGSTTAVVRASGMVDSSQLQYNLFFNDGPAVIQGPGAPADIQIPNFNPVNGDPAFRDPANGNFQLSPNSAAIDAGRSELSLSPVAAPSNLGNQVITTLLPVVNQQLDPNTGIRNQTTNVPGFRNQLDPTNTPVNQLTLPGGTTRGFVDEWFPTLPSDPQGIAGPTTVPGTWVYKPAYIPPGTAGAPGGGERDALGYLRVDDPNKPNVGFGSRPFFDIGAFEYRLLFPPHITDVKATVSDPSQPTGTSTISLYTVGGRAGTNKPLQTIQIQVDHSLDPNTVNGSTVLLEASGGDGIFGNGNNPNDKFYNLSGKVTFDTTTNILTINVGAAGLVLQSDLYRIFLLGSGTEVIRDPQGNALDGENTVNADPNGAQLALPSGDGFPGGNFYDTFVINTVPPTLASGTFQLDASTDSNIIGDLVTSNNLPAFSGTVKVALPNIVPLAGQTVILDISTKGDTVLDPVTGQPIFDRLNAGTAFTDATGRFLVTVGQDAAQTGLVTSSAVIPDSPYNVGPDGILRTADDSHYTLVRIRVIDQSGNVTNLPTDSLLSFASNGALTSTVIDTSPPTITSFSPTVNTVIAPDANGAITFSFTTNKNIDPASLNSNTLLVNRAGPDGVLGTQDDVNVPINVASITTTYLGGAPKGPEKISFQVSGNLPNDLYAVTIKGAGAPAMTDIAGNALAGAFNGTFPTGQNGVAGVDFNQIYAVFASTNIHFHWVGPASFVTNPAAAAGSRTNPFPTIKQGLASASVGDVVGVLPGVYTEVVALKPYVRLISADPSSNDTNFVAGNAQQTVIRAPARSLTSTATLTTVSATNIKSIPGINTELAGFSIASPLLFDPALGPIDPNSVGVLITNADVLLDKNYIVDSNIGVFVVTSGSLAPTPRLVDDGFIGNNTGVVLQDNNTTSLASLTQLINDDFAFNTIGLIAIDNPSSPLMGNIVNDIFWQNHDLTTTRGGTGIVSQVPNKLIVRSSVFANNGPNDKSTADDAVNVGNGFNPGGLTGTPDSLGNLTGVPAFVASRDPRPGADGPAIFFLDANYDLTNKSIAIDAADNSQAVPVDFLYRGRIKIAGRGFPGTGPADIGAFEYKGFAGSTVGGAFRVATTSLAVDGSAKAAGSTFTASSAPTSITVTFSDNVNRSTVTPSSLILSGNGLLPTGPARALSVTWLDSHTAAFKLSGGYNTQGNVTVSISGGTITSVNNTSLLGFTDSFKIVPFISAATPVVAPTTPTTTTTPTNGNPTPVTNPTTPLTPVAAPSPVSLTPAPAKAPTKPVSRKPAKFHGHVVKK